MTLKDALQQKALTVWDMNNVLTQANTHTIRSEIRRIEQEPLIAKEMENLYKHITLQ
mgnify:CR=1 FL=1